MPLGIKLETEENMQKNVEIVKPITKKHKTSVIYN